MSNHPESESTETAVEGIPLKLAKALGLMLAYGVATLMTILAMMGPMKITFGDAVDFSDGAANMAYEGLFMALAVIILNTVLYYGFKSTAAWAGWPDLRASFKGFGNGTLYGLGMAGGMFALTVLMGGGQFSVDGGPWTAYILRVTPLLFYVLIATLGEEALFRGYPLTLVARATTPGWANLILSVLFAVMHASTVGFNGLVAFNIVIGSLVVGALRFTRGGVPCAWGFHFAWNSLQVVLGSALTSIEMKVPVLHFTGIGEDWLSGGEVGPEGGVGATLSTLVVLAVVAVRFHRRGNHDLPFPLGRNRSDTEAVEMS